MDFSPTRRRTLQFGGTVAAAGLAGCLGGGQPEGTLDFEGTSRIDDDALPERKSYTTRDATFPEYRRYDVGREGVDTVLILLHPAGFDSRILQPLASSIVDTGVAHVVTPDLRGHGPNPETRGDIDSIGQLETDLRQLVRTTEKIYPDAKVVIGGHGAGGGVVVRFASTPDGSLADGYLLLGPYLGRDRSTTRQALGGWANFYRDRIFMLNVLTGFGIEGYADMTTVEFDMPEEVRDGTETLAHSYRLMVSYTPEEDDIGEMASVPCLTVVGSDDETAYPDAYELLFADREDTTVELVDDATHLDLVTDDTAVEPIVDWLSDI